MQLCVPKYCFFYYLQYVQLAVLPVVELLNYRVTNNDDETEYQPFSLADWLFRLS